MNAAQKRVEQRIADGLCQPPPYNKYPDVDQNMIENALAGGANFSEVELEIAYKWHLNFREHLPKGEEPPRPFQEIQDEQFSMNKIMYKTYWSTGGYGFYNMKMYVKTGQDFEACVVDGKLDVSKSAIMLD